jgi:hypothetical protein
MHLPHHGHLAEDNAPLPLLTLCHALEEQANGEGEEDNIQQDLEGGKDEGRTALLVVAIGETVANRGHSGEAEVECWRLP